MKYLTCAETARIIREALNEAFGDIKFSVRSKTYSGGASISIRWTDGPNAAQVEAVAKKFEGAYFDGMIDYKGSISHMDGAGQQVHMGADFVFCNRDYSDAAVQRAIDSVYRKFRWNFEQDGVAKPTIEQWKKGELWRVQLSGRHDVQSEIHRALSKNSDRLAVKKSTTAGKYFITHDDGYSARHGSGYSVARDAA